MNNVRRYATTAMGATAATLLTILTPTPAAALVIIDHYSSSIQKSSNSAEIKAAIETASNQISSLFTNDVNVDIDFAISDANNFTGTSGWSRTRIYTSVYLAALADNSAANPSNTTLTTAVANVVSGNASNPSYTGVSETSADERALGIDSPGYRLGFDGDTAADGNAFDGSITLGDLSQLIWSGAVPTTGEWYSAINAVEHEIDEVLGIGGGGSNLGNTRTLGGIDLYRYTSAGTPTMADDGATNSKGRTTIASTASYFSLDGGTTVIEQFNNDAGGDAGDWGPNTTVCGSNSSWHGGPTGLVQDAYSCPGGQTTLITLSSPEAAALEAIGWDPVMSGAPEPASWATLVVGVGLTGSLLRRRRRTRADHLARAVD